jgi:alpha-glucoside transport system permease protein
MGPNGDIGGGRTVTPLVQGMITIVIGVVGCVGYFYLSNLLVDRVIFPARGPNAGRNINRANRLRPWLFLFPAIFALGLYLVYPVIGSFWRSLFNRAGTEFIGFGNYMALFNEGEFRLSVFNNLLWILVVPAAATFFGLISAQLTDKLSWGNIAKSLIFMPMAISFVGASLIWKFVYANNFDIGLINAFRELLGAQQPVDVLQIPFWNNFFLMFILIWIQTGFAMVILSAALRGIPEETVEAAIIDGANPFQIFFKIKIPQIMGTIVVVWTTITILVLKVFDIVYATTGGNFGTQILPSYMMAYMFRDDGRATAVAFVIMILVLPVMIWNIRQARREMR